MNKIYLIFLILGTFLVSSCGYNDMVTKSEMVQKQWGNLQSAYQRRLDLIPNLVETVKGEAKFEQSTLTEVVNARAKATSITIDPSKSSPEQLMAYQESQGQLSQALGKLLSISENYPTLQTNASFKSLKVEIEGTENRIQTERNKYNEAVNEYNSFIKQIPQSFFAGQFGFTPKPYFEAEKAASQAPKVQF
ncbi:MAG: LemA family protein [Chitinophagales bacterium]|jgi:LemA protein|nr:LemA family protein [Chitinophagales bacterium]